MNKLRTPLEEMNNLKSIMEGPQGLRTKTIMLAQQVAKKEEQYSKAKDNNKDAKAQLQREKLHLESSSNDKITKRRQKETDLKTKADKIREEAKEDHDGRVAELNGKIIELKTLLNTKLESHAKEEVQLSAQWENAENNYQSNLD